MPITWASPAVRGGEAAPRDWEQGKNPAPGGGMEGVTASKLQGGLGGCTQAHRYVWDRGCTGF